MSWDALWNGWWNAWSKPKLPDVPTVLQVMCWVFVEIVFVSHWIQTCFVSLQILECEFYLLELMVRKPPQNIVVLLCFLYRNWRGVIECLSGWLITDVFSVSGLLPNCVPPLQTTVAVCAGYGTGGHAAASGLVWNPFAVCGKCIWWSCFRMFSLPLSSVFTRRIVNDTYRTDLCLLYPPFMIALGKRCPLPFLIAAVNARTDRFLLY